MSPRWRFILFLILLSLCLFAFPQRHKSTRGKLKAIKTEQKTQLAPLDTIRPDSGIVVVSGYDKRLDSRHESMLITNNSDRDICGIAFFITYFDSAERQVHERKVEKELSLSPGQTKIIDFPSWDKQCSWYYKYSAPARTYTPTSSYTVKVNIYHILCPPADEPARNSD